MLRKLILFIFIFLCGSNTFADAQRQRVTGVLMGTVMTPSGAPISHAQVVIFSADQTLRSRQQRHRTDQDGTFRVRLPVGQYWVQVVAVGFVSHWYEDTQARGDALPVVISEPGVEVVWPVVMEPIAAVSGRVVDENTGQVIGSGVVHIESQEARLRKRTSIDDGLFVLEGLFPGAYDVQILVDGYVTETRKLTFASGDRLGPLEITLSKGITVTGGVRGQSGEALGGAVIVARPITRDGRVQHATSLPDGTFEISGLVDGSYIFEAQKVGFAKTYYNGQDKVEQATLVQVGRGQTPSQINFVLGQVEAIVGRVTNAENQPIFGARVVAEPLGDGQRIQTRTDEDGHYVLAQVAEGAYFVRAFADGYMSFYFDGVQNNGEATSVLVTDDAHTEAVNFVLLPGGKIEGVVWDRDTSKPVGDALVSVRWVGYQGMWQTQTDRSGNFLLGDLPSGDFVVQVSSKKHVTEFYGRTTDIEQAKQIKVEAGETVSDIVVGVQRRSPGDFDGNGRSDFHDLLALVRHLMGKKAFESQMDLNLDGTVGMPDLMAFVHLRASKVASEQAGLHWEQVQEDPQILTAQLGIEQMLPAKGFVLQVVYDAQAAELLGVDEAESGAFLGHPLLVQRYNGTALIALDGKNMDAVQSDGALLTLRFRLNGGATAVPIEIVSAFLFSEDGQLVPMRLPDKFSLELPPQSYRLMQNLPNPFNPATTIGFELPEAADVDVAVYNLVGQRLRTLVQEHKVAGRYQVVWDGKDDAGRDVSSGVYFYRYRAGDFWASRRMLLIR